MVLVNPLVSLSRDAARRVSTPYSLRRLLLGFLFVICIESSYSQTKNRLDAAGRKQGYWEAVDRRGALLYSGYFVDDRPIGEFKRYYPTGGVRVIMNHDSASTKVRARFFWQNGDLAARGNYIETKRDSVWLYYSNNTKSVSRRVEYAEGKQHGKEQSFFPDGNVAEEIIWENGLKNGPWVQYFKNGQPKLTATYINDQLEGAFSVLSPNGKKEIEGAYRQGVRDGEWKHYDENGKLMTIIRYAGGKITNLDEVDAAQQEFFKKLMEQEGKIKEPSFEEIMREMQ